MANIYSKDTCVVVFSTDWNYTNGGINAFNFDFCIALGKQLRQSDTFLVIVSLNKTETIHSDHARDLGIRLISLGKTCQERFQLSDIKHINKHLEDYCQGKSLIFVGHDIFTGDFANMMRDSHFGTRSIVFHHMNYEAYYAIKGNIAPKDLQEKLSNQKKILKESDLVVGIGPKLYESAKQKTGRKETQIIPGLQQIKSHKKRIGNLRAITFGRYDTKTDRLKQMQLAVQVYVDWLKQDHRKSIHDSVMIVVGISEPKEAEDFLAEANKEADRYTNILALPYSDNRETLFDELSSSTVALMLSVHEGFGLMGLESIAAEVPLILTINSGLYEFLASKIKEDSFTSFGILPVSVKGPTNTSPINKDDKKTVLDALNQVDQHKDYFLQGIKKLKRKLGRYTWEKSARDFLKTTGITVSSRSLDANSVSPGKKVMDNNLPVGLGDQLIGRESSIEEIRESINKNGTILLLYGPSGVGKSALAVEIGKKISEYTLNIKRSFSKVIWISASTSIITYDGIWKEQGCSTLEDMLARIAVQLRISEVTRKLLSEQEELILQALKEQQVFLIFDNFEAVVDHRILLFLKKLSNINCVLITGREKLSLSHIIPLKPLSQEDTKILIEKEAASRSISLTDEHKQGIFQVVGGIPLAILWSLVQLENSSNITAAITVLKEKEDHLLEFCFSQSMLKLRNSESPKLLMALALFPGGATDSQLSKTSGINEQLNYEKSISLLRRHCLVKNSEDRTALLPLTKRFIVNYVRDENIYFESCKTRHHETICNFLTPLAEKLWTTGIDPIDWNLDAENIYETIQLWKDNGKTEQLCELLIHLYPFTLTFGRWEEYIEICTFCLSSTGVNNDMQLRLLFRITSIYEHAGKKEDSDTSMKHITELLVSAEDLSADERNLYHFITTIRSINRGLPETDDLIETSIAFEKSRGMDWTLIGFMGWKGIHLCKTMRYPAGKKTLEDAISLATDYKQFRSLTFLFPVYLRIINAMKIENINLGYSFSDMLQLGNEFGEIHNKAHLLKELGIYNRIHSATDADMAYFDQAREIYKTLGMQEHVVELELTINN